MNPTERRQLVSDLRAGRLSVAKALERLRAAAVGVVGNGVASVDHDRTRRTGFPEVILCEGKAPADCGRIAAEILRRAPRLLATRVDAAALEALRSAVPRAVFHARARCVTVGRPPRATGRVAIVCAGTADVPVAEEARVTAEHMGARVETFYDVGVAGLHRLLRHADAIGKARAVVVAAGMEGALASVVGGLVAVPVLAVPTRGGYGATFDGLAALLAFVNSCAANVACVGIDDGFGAGHMAALINGAASRRR